LLLIRVARCALPGAPAGSRGGSMLDLIYLVLVIALFALSIAMIRFFDRL
jgi:flagellar basal body-associated protein FliL